MTTPKAFDTIEAARAFALGGDALITLQSRKTDTHYTYSVKLGDPEKFPTPTWFVKILSEGSIDEGSLTYIGMIRNGHFGTTKASEKMKDAPCVRAFDYFMRVKNLEHLIVRHNGRCGKCGRTLTEPESIDSGFGPVCRAAMGI